MKILILLLSFLFILSSGCGSESEESSSTSGDSTTNGEETTAGGDNPTGKPVISNNSIPPAPVTVEVEPPDPCTPYAQACKSDKECGEKYLNCLRPKAGDPAKTETVTCTKTGEVTYTLVVNEWDAKPSTNNLLCDFIENEEILYLFATLVKDSCKNDRDSRKAELTKLGYACN